MPGADSRLHQDALRRVLGVARLLGATDNLHEVLSVIIDAMRDVLDAERATVFEHDAERSELFSSVAHGVAAGPGVPDEIRIAVGQGLAGQCAQSRRVINVPDAYADPRFNPGVDRATGFRTRSILTIPLEGVDGELIGVAQVLNKRGGPFGPDDEEIASALAAQAAVAIKRARLLDDRLMREKLEREIELARHVQQQSFPSRLPEMPGYDLAAYSEPAEKTGGDAYDVVGFVREGAGRQVVANGSPAHGALFFMADATGHGVGPALSVTQVRSMLRMGARVGAGVMETAAQINRQLCEDLPPGLFVTAWIGELDADAHTLDIFSAGQAPLLLHRASSNEVDVRDADTMPFGILPDMDVDRATRLTLEPGDLYAVISDGIIEAAREGGEQFGLDRLIALFREMRGAPCQEITERIRRDVREFTNDAPAADDQTVVLIRRLA